MDEAGHRTGPAACSVPAESERHVGREVGERGHKTSPAACFVPRESEPHTGGEVGGISIIYCLPGAQPQGLRRAGA